ncbi:hypothetical protein U14_00427 [Candidatus Moduliflexus flocculans]|uniref:Uncharacterized protein n=1 Tax=Candidatus Moduliflexus flocculans TaxID=1499966 RepID=A0A0S6VUG4_9BACT|nr:hypothetical protein U14_00427 [Candidatus Moduliflexus flocculans]
MLIYCDTNVYARPFDDQTSAAIQAEANAFLELIDAVKTGKLHLLSSDILFFEVHHILNEEKRAKVIEYLKLCDRHIDNSLEILELGKQIETLCHNRARDALHLASAILGAARYFLSCDRNVIMMPHAKCYRRLGKAHRQEYFSVMNPVRFVEKLKQGDLA